jgi:hypothetical protein
MVQEQQEEREEVCFLGAIARAGLMTWTQVLVRLTADRLRTSPGYFVLD